MRGHRTAASRVQRFTIVGVVATVVDLAILLWLLTRGVELMYADLASVTVATVASYVLHRMVTLAGHPSRRWYENFAGSYLSAVFGSLCADVVIFTVLVDLFTGGGTSGGADTFPLSGWPTGMLLAKVLVAKAVALVVAAALRRSAYRSILGYAVRHDQAAPRAQRNNPDGPRLSVVVPAFHEEDRIAHTIRELRTQLEPALALATADAPEGALEIVVVDDGSADSTAAVAAEAGADQVVRLEENHGKGAAVRSGMLVATGRARAFIDADLAYSPEQLLGLLAKVEEGWDVVIGSRKHTSTTTLVRAGRLRELGSRVVNVLTSVALLGQYRDTQCGLKAFSAGAAEDIFSVTHIDRFAMDIEVIFLVERGNLSLVEVPVTVSNSERSTVRVVRDTARLLRDVVRIRVLAKGGAYDRDVPAAERAPTALDAPTPRNDLS